MTFISELVELVKDPNASVLLGLMFTTVVSSFASLVNLYITTKKKNKTNTEKQLESITESIESLRVDVENLNDNNDRLKLSVKRTELQIAIDNDYGLEVVSKIFDDYTEQGGNSYMHTRFEDYQEEKRL